MKRAIQAVLVVAVLAAGCGDDGDSASSMTARAPYDVYLERNPDPSLVLSREDAQTRAMLGCGEKWAPGTIDAVLAEAYAELCE
jgi:hypothetical protein